jgi:two-component system chemotaxis sensor kinase CheA
MAIVWESVTKLGGTVQLESTAGLGTTVRILLPLTLATLRGTLVRVAHREFVIPTANVARTLRVTRASIKPVEGRDSICLDGTTLALVPLAAVLGLAPSQTTADGTAPLTVVVLDHGRACLAFAVDEVVGEQEVLAKPLGRLLPRVRNLAGATVLGTGRVVPILSVPDLLQTATICTLTTATETGPGAAGQVVRAKRVLVAEDSITARTVLQAILESAGYEVQTATDGAAAYAALRSATFDLLVTDVEMPRMDGFELTKRVRAEPQLAELPVVLVTARETKEDRERGLDAGANGYIVKSSFEQSNLLEVIGRLV